MNSSRIAHAALVAVLTLAATGPATVATAETLVLRGGTVHSMVPGAAASVADVVVQDGRIVSVGAAAQAPAGARVVDVAGLDVYPGFFDAMSTIGLIEISSIDATVDAAEMPAYNPHLRAATAIHPDSEVIPVSRSTGITHSLVSPQAGQDGVIPGQASLVHLDGWTVEEMSIEPSAAMVIAWPQIRTRRFDFSTFTLKESSYSEAKKEAEEALKALEGWLDAARHYAKAQAAGSQRTERNLQLEHLAKVLDGGQRVVVLANSKSDIEAAVEFAEEQGLNMILAGGRDAWKVTEMLAEKQIPVILGLVAELPNQDDHPYDRPFGVAGALRAAGVRIAFGSAVPSGGFGGPDGPHSARTLPFEAGMATGYGLSREDALRALTVAPAEIFGVADQLGTIEVGKRANLVVVEGDPLAIRSAVRHLIVDGKEVELGTDRHSRLYERFRSRPTSD